MMVDLITPACTVCGIRSKVPVTLHELHRYNEGEMVQDIWPDMPKDEREVIITGTHPACWVALFPPDEEW